MTRSGSLEHQQQSSRWGKWARKERYSSDTKEGSHDSDKIKEEGNICREDESAVYGKVKVYNTL